MRLTVLGILVATLVPVGPGIAGAGASECQLPQAERSAAEPVELCGTTTISGTEAGAVTVTLRRPVNLNPDIGVGGVQIVGTGPFVGVALIQDPPTPESLGFVAAKTPVEFSGETFRPLGSDLQGCGPCLLPAGRYRLYLLANGSQVTASLKLQGAPGTTTLVPERSTAFQARSLTRRTELVQNLVAATAGDSIQVNVPAFLYAGIRVHGVQVMGGGILQCPEGDDPPGWTPVCPNDEYFPNNGEAVGSTGDMWVGHGGPQTVNNIFMVGPGRYSQSAWFLTPEPPTRVDMIGVWLPFD
jgi:hypothetical protein